MHHSRTSLLAILVGAALIVGSTASALGQESSPAPEASMAAEASPAAEIVEPSTLGILQIATDKQAGTPLKGKKYRKAIAKAAPNAVGYLITTAGVDDIDRIIELSRMARAVDEAGDAKVAKALIDIATLLYRNEWTKTGSDPLSLNDAIQGAVAAAGLEGNPALMHAAIWENGFIDICFDDRGPWFYNPQTPSLCEDEDGQMVRADVTGFDAENPPALDEIDVADAGGVGIHKVVQDKTANDKLAGKQYKKALAKTLKESGPAVAGYNAGGSGAGRMNGIIDMVLLAREADEAGNAKAAKAFMALALAAFREGLTSSEQPPREFVTALHELGQTTYEGQPGVALLPPSGFELICLNKKKDGLDYFAAPEDLWACTGQGGRVLFVAADDPDLDPSKNGAAEGLYKGDG